MIKWGHDALQSGASNNGFFCNVWDATFVGWPILLLSLALLNHLAKLQRKLVRLATTDMLTGLPNRSAFLVDIACDTHLHRCGSFLMIDLDCFKRINVFFGYQVGDLCLRAAADFLLDNARTPLSCARL